ncbi:nagb/rpia/CoA transferase-like protein [Fistulina hepatica ATCC 64428]|uniref:5-formyltetrahydrofolate cyclo-ligase n=1 Tax=Fistulina hepatica ATCC 64428 TaxID=1128425 RepID=A0A0D7AR07_9AGAR|nr:nagb/rpia/CoA transferase-like protein [Fistulina hepatica ATCC 64428]
MSMIQRASLQAEKKAMRLAIFSALSQIPESSLRTQCTSFATLLLAVMMMRPSKTISCYLSMPTAEFDTSSLVQHILREVPSYSGKNLLVPKIVDRKLGLMDFFMIHNEGDLDSLPGGLWGIREPGYTYKGLPRLKATDRDCPLIDVIIVPGVAFDKSFARLGHGKGFYDRYIRMYSQGRVPPKLGEMHVRKIMIALALNEQIVEKVPTEEHDENVDIIVTASELHQPTRHS